MDADGTPRLSQSCLFEEKTLVDSSDYARGAGGTRSPEKFGLGFGVHSGDTAHVDFVVWPMQEARSPVACQIDGRDLGLILPFLHDLADRIGAERAPALTAWVHTHPGLGLFLSSTDQATIANWSQHNPQLVAAVIDPYARETKRLGVFDSSYRAIDWKAKRDVAISGGDRYCARLVAELPVFMRERGRPLEGVATPAGSLFGDSEVSRATAGTGHGADVPGQSEFLSADCWCRLMAFREKRPGLSEVAAVPLTVDDDESADHLLLLDATLLDGGGGSAQSALERVRAALLGLSHKSGHELRVRQDAVLRLDLQRTVRLGPDALSAEELRCSVVDLLPDMVWRECHVADSIRRRRRQKRIYELLDQLDLPVIDVL